MRFKKKKLLSKNFSYVFRYIKLKKRRTYNKNDNKTGYIQVFQISFI